MRRLRPADVAGAYMRTDCGQEKEAHGQGGHRAVRGGHGGARGGGDSFVDVPRSDLAAGAKVGDVVVSSGGRYVVDAAETAARKDRAAKLAKGLFKD